MKSLIADSSLLLMIISMFFLLTFCMVMPVYAMGVSDNELEEDSPDSSPDDTPDIADDEQQSDLPDNKGALADEKNNSVDTETISETSGDNGQNLYLDEEYRQCVLDNLELRNKIAIVELAFIGCLVGVMLAGLVVRWFVR